MTDYFKDINKENAKYEFVFDTKLNMSEIGLLSFMLTLPDIKNITVAELLNMLPDSKNTIVSALNTLNKEGYVKRKFTNGMELYEASEFKHADRKMINASDNKGGTIK